MGLAAVPLPMKNRTKSEIGFDVSDPTAAAPGDSTAAGSTGAPLLIAAADFAVPAVLPSSRRLNASAVHASGADAGPSPVPPEASQSSKFPPRPLTPPVAAAGRGAALITGAAAAAGTVTTAGRGAAGTAETSAPTEAGDPASGSPGTFTAEESDHPESAGTEGSSRPDALSAEPLSDEPLPDKPLPTTAAGVSGRLRRVLVPLTADPAAALALPPCTPDAESPSTPAASDEPAPVVTADDGPDRGRDRVVPGFEADRDAPPERVDSASAEPTEPAEPVVSADAKAGITHAAAPTPSATASVPTRPTYTSVELTKASFQ